MIPARLPRPASCWVVLIVALGLLLSAGTALAQAQDPGSTIQIEPGQDVSHLYGTPITRVEVQQRSSRWRSPASVSSVKAGDRFDPAVARTAARELLATGGFASVSVSVIPETNGVAMVLTAVPRRTAAGRRLTGSPFEEGDLWREAGVVAGSELTESGLNEISESIRMYHVRRGYPAARVTVETRDTDDPMGVFVVVEVTPGPAEVFASRHIVIPPAMRLALSEAAEKYAVAKGDKNDELKLAEADRQLQNELQGRSYPKARVTHAIARSQGRTFLYVYVIPGPRLRIRFEGNRSFDRDQLSDALDYDTEPDRSPAHLASKIVAFYRSAGFLDAAVKYEERGRETDLVNDLVFTVREGEQVRVLRREFPCLPRNAPKSASELESEIDSFLVEDLPGAGLLGPVDSSSLDDVVGPHGPTGARPAPLRLDPAHTYVPGVYDKAVAHLQDLFRSEGYLSALAGPVQVIRRTCSPRSPPGKCIPLPLPHEPPSACPNDRGVPLEGPDQDPALMCKPDPARGVFCEPFVILRIPIKLGPMATLFDISFEGNRRVVETKLAEEAGLELGKPASNVALEQARRRILDLYREYGFAYADVRAVLDLSPDRTVARARFIITESEQVIVDKFVVRGAVRTNESLILGRVALKVGEPYSQSLVRKTEERIATLGTFGTVSVSLLDPYVPAHHKIVVITVQERLPQYLDIRPGFSTGEGFRIQFEYGHRNVGGQAIQLTFRLRLGYLPDPFILDEAVRTNLDPLPVSQRMERMNTASVLFPEVGLGPLISLGIDGADVRSNYRDFGLSKDAISTALNYRPMRGVNATLGASGERNDVAIFNGQTVTEYLSRPGVTSDLGRLLRVPDGLTYAVAQQFTASWDRRDIPFGATRGTLLSASVEHVRAFPASDNPNSKLSDFLKASATFGGYVRLSRRGLALAVNVRVGRIFQLISNSNTYPDRLFFMGGVNSLRGFLQDSMVPQDVAEKILHDAKESPNDPTRLTVNQVAIRGGDAFINPRAELRVPVTDTVQTALFLDTGNVWVEPGAFDPFVLRYAAGSGLRIGTPIGPIAFDYGINLMRRSWRTAGPFTSPIGLF